MNVSMLLFCLLAPAIFEGEGGYVCRRDGEEVVRGWAETVGSVWEAVLEKLNAFHSHIAALLLEDTEC